MYFLPILIGLALPAMAERAAKIPDTSGMAPLGENQFLVVHDKKGHKKAGGRLGIIKTPPGKNVVYDKLKVDWSPVADF